LSGNKLNINDLAEAPEAPPELQPSTEEAAGRDTGRDIPDPVPALKRNAWSDIVDRISYQGIVRNMPFLMFLTVLCILYITNNNRAISLTRSINDKTKELKELRWKYMDLQSRLMFQTSETQITEKTAAIGLKPLDKPAFEIKVEVPVPEED